MVETKTLYCDENFRYAFLSRLKLDCDYFLTYGSKNEKHLWAGNVTEQIEKMEELWKSFPEGEKPEWLTWEDIQNYKIKMKGGIF